MWLAGVGVVCLHGGGGGAGGLTFCHNIKQFLQITPYTVTVGVGGAGGTSPNPNGTGGKLAEMVAIRHLSGTGISSTASGGGGNGRVTTLILLVFLEALAVVVKAVVTTLAQQLLLALEPLVKVLLVELAYRLWF